MYNKLDQSYKLQPKIMDLNVTVPNLFKKIKSYALEKGVEQFNIILHGGEPMLCGLDYFKSFVEIGKEIIGDTVEIDISMQTNGVLIDNEWLKELNKLNITFGISLDGSKESNDRNRIYHNGKGSYQHVIDALDLIKESEHKAMYGGILTVIDINNDPEEVYNHLVSLGPPGINFLFPDNTFDEAYYTSSFQNPLYGKWLASIFDIWFEDNESPHLKIFHDIIHLLIGDEIVSGVMGTENNNFCIIETNGEIEASDSLKGCGENFTKTGLNINNNSLDEASENDLIRLDLYSNKIVADKCKSCPIYSVCGSGFLVNRFNKKNGFDNPTVYCNDIIYLFSHIQNKMIDDLDESIKAEMEYMTPFKINNDIASNLKTSEGVDSKELLTQFAQI